MASSDGFNPEVDQLVDVKRDSFIRRTARLAGNTALKGLCWSAGAALVLGPLGYTGWKHFDDTSNKLKTSVDDLNRTASNGIPEIGNKLGSLDNTAKNFVPSSTTTTEALPPVSVSTTELNPNSDQVAAGAPSTSSSSTTSTTVAGQP